ncbi:MAG: hypothetical protein APF77_23275 [Clostridia bacterium BRH_c25]|nr:MAG: hypothetical protein APF77_23275 [Clostridia bacterium BRH_c25]
MNEVFIKEIIKYKLHTANTIIGQLPPELSEEIRKIGKVILESLNEGFQDIKDQPAKKAKPSDKLNNVSIE